MEKIESFNEVLDLLKNRQIVCGIRKDLFVYKKEKVYRYFSGSSIVMSPEDFIELYRDETFFLYENSDTFIDEEKDEAYYRYYRK